MDMSLKIPNSNVLKNVVAFVDVKSSLGCIATAISLRLQSLGADISRTRSPNVTHVIFRNGSDDSKAWAAKIGAHLVTPAWVKACHTYQCKISEKAFAVCDDESEAFLPEHSLDVHKDQAATDDLPVVPDPILQCPFRRTHELAPLSVPPAIQRYFQRLHRQKCAGGEYVSSSDSDSDKISTLGTAHDLRPPLSTKRNSLKASSTAECSQDASRDSSVSSPLRSEALLHPTCSIADICRSDLQTHRIPSAGKLARRLAPVGGRTHVDEPITPLSSDRKPPGTFASTKRRQSFLNAKRQLSPSTPITPDMLLDWVQKARTPKMKRTTSCSPFTKSAVEHNPVKKIKRRGPTKLTFKRATARSVNSTVPSGANLGCNPSKNKLIKCRRDFSRSKNAAVSGNPSSITNLNEYPKLANGSDLQSTASHRAQTLTTRLKMLKANAEVDLDRSFSTLSFPPLDASLSLCRSTSKNTEHCADTQFFSRADSKIVTEFRGARRWRTNGHPLPTKGASTAETDSLHIKPIAIRNSLDDFDLRSLPHATLRGAVFVIAFTGLRKEEELVMQAILRSSKLQHYEFATSNASRPMDIKKCTHLVTTDPYRRTMNLLRGLFSETKIVTTQWITQSAQFGVWFREQNFVPSGLPRLSRVRLLPTLFSKLGLIYVAAHHNPPRRDLVELLELGGAHVTNRQLQASLIIGTSKTEAPGVRSTWLLDSIVRAKLLPVKPYACDQ